MNIRRLSPVFFAHLVSLALVPCLAEAQVSVTTYHNDNSRTGQNISETTLTPSSVSGGYFGRLFSVLLDGQVYAQPLYLANVKISNGTHNVLYVATENDSLYAIDADVGTIYWQLSFLTSGATTVSTSDVGGCTNIAPVYGITGTPVIDTTTGTIYVVVNTKENGSIVYRLHAIDVVTHAEKFGGPVLIQASVAGTGSGNIGGRIYFNPQWQLQRPGLLLTNGHVIIGFGAHCDFSTWFGWVMSYNAATLAQEGVFNSVPNGDDGGVWMSGGGLAVDSSGNVYFGTGNGDWDGVDNLGDSIIKLPPPPKSGQWYASDYFTPWDQSSLESGDTDLGSGGLLLLPDLPPGTAHQQRLIQAGKKGWIEVVDRNSLGHICSSCHSVDTNIVQEIQGQLPGGVWGAPAYSNGLFYYGGSGDYLKAFSFDTTTGAVSTSPVAQSTNLFSSFGPTVSVSSKGNSNGVVWALDTSTLYAYNATSLSYLYSSDGVLGFDEPGSSFKFNTPTIANGKVYIAGIGPSSFGSGTVSAYGVLPCHATLSCTGKPGVWASGSITLSCNTPSNISTTVRACIQSDCHSASGSSGLLTQSSASVSNDDGGGRGSDCQWSWSINGQSFSWIYGVQ